MLLYTITVPGVASGSGTAPENLLALKSYDQRLGAVWNAIEAARQPYQVLEARIWSGRARR